MQAVLSHFERTVDECYSKLSAVYVVVTFVEVGLILVVKQAQKRRKDIYNIPYVEEFQIFSHNSA